MVLEIGKQKHARGFEVGKRAMQDRQSDVKWYHSISDCPKTGFLPVPAAGSIFRILNRKGDLFDDLYFLLH